MKFTDWLKTHDGEEVTVGFAQGTLQGTLTCHDDFLTICEPNDRHVYAVPHPAPSWVYCVDPERTKALMARLEAKRKEDERKPADPFEALQAQVEREQAEKE
jgi:hypothetical protein